MQIDLAATRFNAFDNKTRHTFCGMRYLSHRQTRSIPATFNPYAVTICDKWHHRSCHHRTRNAGMVSYMWSIRTNHLPCTDVKIWCFKDIGSWPWPFGVMLHHQSRNHWTCNMGIPIDGPISHVGKPTPTTNYYPRGFGMENFTPGDPGVLQGQECKTTTLIIPFNQALYFRWVKTFSNFRHEYYYWIHRL